jgi:hypothetical protein
MATRWRMPPESSQGYFDSNSARPTDAMSARARSRCGRESRPRISNCTSTLPSTVRQSSSRSFWNTMPMFV